ncbi:hypothetical protein CH063_14233 [Colletotrichum higginsianum]|uniref:Uncharacterized protein n=1 Tax=Colletotrichum higginsianum (strain IMI 349063) TaxID=759273 RepID=H1VXQ3_COLHI|nr:hypothetical protein CH063_14233 [Colletotrichum higginsianum]
MYEKCGLRVKAAEEAVKLKDAEAWGRLLEAAGRGTQEGRDIERIGSAVFKKASGMRARNKAWASFLREIDTWMSHGRRARRRAATA